MMFTVYISCLIFGGILLISSFFFSGDAEADTDGVPEISDNDVGDAIDAVKFISYRNIIYLMTFFGLTGLVLDLLQAGFFISLLGASVVGLFSAYAGYQLFKYLRTSESGDAISISDLRGKQAKVTVTSKKEKKGKIILESGGKIIEIFALLSDSATENEVKPGEKVLIIATKHDIAYVIKEEI